MDGNKVLRSLLKEFGKKQKGEGMKSIANIMYEMGEDDEEDTSKRE